MKLNLPEFKDKKEEIAYLVKNKLELIDLKKSVSKFFVDTPCQLVDSSGLVSKATNNSQDTSDTIYRTLVGNTYNWMDSHDDVHLNNVFAQSLKDRVGKIPHRHDHVPQLTAKVGKFSNVYEQVVNWTDLGVNKMGQTMALLGDSAIKKAYNSLIFDSYKDNEIDQHSVGMRYSKLALAVNDASNPEEFEVWRKYIGLLGNPELALEKGYFWAIKEAILIEISCVTEGSNPITGMYNPSTDSVNIDPPLEQSPNKSFYSHFLN